MSDFSKIKTGISGLKKENEDLKKGYAFLSDELSRAVSENDAGIKSLSDKAASLSASVSGLEEKAAAAGAGISKLSSSVSSDISGIRRALDMHKKAVSEIGDRLQRMSDASEATAKEVAEGRKESKELTGSLQELGRNVSGITEKVAAIGAATEERLSATEGRLTSALDILRKGSADQTSVMKTHDAALKKSAMDLQSLRKDLSAVNERVLRAKDAAAKNARKLETLGTLESKIKHIEDVKTGLVKGVESLQGMRNDMAALSQKTRDIDSRLTAADKNLDAKIKEKTDFLDAQMAGKTDAMESQMQERLKFLEGSVSEKARSFEALLGTRLSALQKAVAAGDAEIKRLREFSRKAGADIRDAQKSFMALRAAEGDDKKDMAALAARMNSLETLTGRIAEIEQAKDAVLAGMSDLQSLSQKLSVLTEKGRAFETRVSRDIQNLRTLTGKNSTAASDMKVDFTALRKETAQSARELSELKGGLASASSGLESLSEEVGILNEKSKSFADAVTSDVSSLRAEVSKDSTSINSLSSELSEMKAAVNGKLAPGVSSLAADARKSAGEMSKMKLDMAGMKKVMGSGLPADIAALKSVSQKNSDALTRMKLDMTSVKKDISASGKGAAALKASLASAAKKLEALDALDAKIREVEGLGGRLEEKLREMKPLQDGLASLRKDVEAGRTALDNTETVLSNKLDYNITSLKKDAALNATAASKAAEETKRLTLELRALSKDLQALKAESKTKDSYIEEKVREGVKALESGVTSGMSTIKSLDAALKKTAMDVASLKKDGTAGSKAIEGLDARLSALQQKSQEMEKLQVRLSEMDDAKAAMTEMMEAKLEEKMKFLHTVMKQKEDNVEADLKDRTAAMEKKLSKDIGDVRKGVSSAAAALEKLRSRTEALPKVDERTDALEKELRALRAQTDAGLAEVRRLSEASRSASGDKFSTAVKAFLSSKAELSNKVGLLDLRVSESDKRVDELKRALTRIDLLEKKIDRLTEKGEQVRRDVDGLSRKEESPQKVTIVDLERDGM